MNKFLLAPLLFAVATVPAYAQVAPDAGRVLQEQKAPLELPKEQEGLALDQNKAQPAPEPGGPMVTLQSLSLTGNSLYTEAELLALLGDMTGKTYDLAGLKGLATILTDFYHTNGYPFARALVPQQKIQDGRVTIIIVEGRYGEIKTEGDPDLTEDAQDFFSSLHPGDTIESASLERATLILDDQPGIKAVPIIRPGQQVGTGDLRVQVSRQPSVSGSLGFDNYGNRYSGEYRGKADFQIDSPILFGDQVLLQTLVTDENLWLGSVSYSLPLGSSGLRAQAGYAQTTYELGKQFEDLDATGYATISTIGASYPLIRSQAFNLSLAGLYQHKDLQDKQGSTGTKSNKYSDTTPANLQFDLRDSLLGGGITYGVVNWTYGNLHLDSDLKATDGITARTAGNFNKMGLDMARIQKLPDALTLFGRFSGQWTNDNLDSSEGFGLGGANGVRAYPVGEAYGDRGWLAQVELRYNIDDFTPYAFYDSGDIAVNASPWDNGVNDRNIAGAGFGLRYGLNWINFDATLAWKTQGGKPESDSADRIPQGWISASVKF